MNSQNKTIAFFIFLLSLVLIMLFNIIIFPSFLLCIPNNSDVNIATNDETSIKQNNEITKEIISEKKAISYAKSGLNNDIDKPKEYNSETSTTTTKYIYNNVNHPSEEPMWIIIFSNSYKNYDYQLPNNYPKDRISEAAWRLGLVWKDNQGHIFEHYEQLTTFVIVEINAITGKYRGCEVSNVPDEQEMIFLLDNLKQHYGVDFELAI